jgi:hypothetical protein
VGEKGPTKVSWMKHFNYFTLSNAKGESAAIQWVHYFFLSFCTGALNRLKLLRIWHVVTGWSQTRYELNPTFRSNLKIALCGGYVHFSCC